jgi:hypothetical protein
MGEQGRTISAPHSELITHQILLSTQHSALSTDFGTEAGMTKVASAWAWGVATVLLMVAAMSAWRFAPELAVKHATDAYTASLGIRSLAVALAAAAQVLLLTCVVGRVYPIRFADKLFSAALALTALAALATAAALCWSSR